RSRLRRRHRRGPPRRGRVPARPLPRGHDTEPSRVSERGDPRRPPRLSRRRRAPHVPRGQRVLLEGGRPPGRAGRGRDAARGGGGAGGGGPGGGVAQRGGGGKRGGGGRRTGPPPQQLVGVGFTSQGPFEGSYYRRAPGAADPRASWIFEGVTDEILGDFGLSG